MLPTAIRPDMIEPALISGLKDWHGTELQR